MSNKQDGLNFKRLETLLSFLEELGFERIFANNYKMFDSYIKEIDYDFFEKNNIPFYVYSVNFLGNRIIQTKRCFKIYDGNSNLVIKIKRGLLSNQEIKSIKKKLLTISKYEIIPLKIVSGVRMLPPDFYLELFKENFFKDLVKIKRLKENTNFYYNTDERILKIEIYKKFSQKRKKIIKYLKSYKKALKRKGIKIKIQLNFIDKQKGANMYCRFNKDLFNSFQSMKHKIKPELSDDWEIIFENYNSNTDVILFSKKLNTKITGIEIFNVFNTLTHYKVDLKEGKYIQGEFIIGKNRKLYSKEDYEEWLKKYKNFAEGTVQAKDLKVGKLYQFKCGAEGYLIAIDRNEKNKPLYIFGEIKKEFENSKAKEVFLQMENSLKNISKELEDEIDNKKKKILLSSHLTRESKFYKKKLHDFRELVLVIDKDGNILDNDYFSDKDFYNFDCFNYFVIDGENPSLLSEILLNYTVFNYSVDYKRFKHSVENVRIQDNKIVFDYGYYNFDRDIFISIKKDIIFKDELFVYQINKKNKENLLKNLKF